MTWEAKVIAAAVAAADTEKNLKHSHPNDRGDLNTIKPALHIVPMCWCFFSGYVSNRQ